ncbi:hypothetical protein Bca101_080329 [Brassica carinata]
MPDQEKETRVQNLFQDGYFYLSTKQHWHLSLQGRKKRFNELLTTFGHNLKSKSLLRVVCLPQPSNYHTQRLLQGNIYIYSVI